MLRVKPQSICAFRRRRRHDHPGALPQKRQLAGTRSVDPAAAFQSGPTFEPLRRAPIGIVITPGHADIDDLSSATKSNDLSIASRILAASRPASTNTPKQSPHSSYSHQSKSGSDLCTRPRRRRDGQERISPGHIIPCPCDHGEFSFFKAGLSESLSLFFTAPGLFGDLACGARNFL
jgi:hypothetical protein